MRLAFLAFTGLIAGCAPSAPALDPQAPTIVDIEASKPKPSPVLSTLIGSMTISAASPGWDCGICAPADTCEQLFALAFRPDRREVALTRIEQGNPSRQAIYDHVVKHGKPLSSGFRQNLNLTDQALMACVRVQDL